MEKSQAINILNNRVNNKLTNSNTTFANINSSKDVWWLEPTNEKFKGDLNIVLNNSESKTLYHFFIPANTVVNSHNTFYQRNIRNKTHTEILKSNAKFLDEKSDFDFSPYLENEVTY